MKGRPTVYTDKLGREICDRLADGESVRSICRDDHMPDEKQVRTWALNDQHPFSPQYARAREIGYARLAEEIIEIADDSSDDWLPPENSDDDPRLNHEAVARSRLRVDTRKWLLSKMLPKMYGDKVTQEVTGKDGAPLVPVLNVTVTRDQS